LNSKRSSGNPLDGLDDNMWMEMSRPSYSALRDSLSTGLPLNAGMCFSPENDNDGALKISGEKWPSRDVGKIEFKMIDPPDRHERFNYGDRLVVAFAPSALRSHFCFHRHRRRTIKQLDRN
jgi:hypothetical protein